MRAACARSHPDQSTASLQQTRVQGTHEPDGSLCCFLASHGPPASRQPALTGPLWLHAGLRRHTGQRCRCSRCPPTARRRASRRSRGRRCRASGCAHSPDSMPVHVPQYCFDAIRGINSCGRGSDGPHQNDVVVRSIRTPSFRQDRRRSTMTTLLGQIECASSLAPHAVCAMTQRAQTGLLIAVWHRLINHPTAGDLGESSCGGAAHVLQQASLCLSCEVSARDLHYHH